MKEITKLELLLKEGRITRRDFLARVSAMGLMAAVSPALFTYPALASTPKKGGRLRLGVSGASTTQSLDPVTNEDQWIHCINYGQLKNNLVEINHKGEAVPELAENWEPSPDAKIWHFNLRKGVEFHNGKTLDADDVIWSINYHRGEESKSPVKSSLASIKNLRADGKHAVIFTLERGNTDFPYVMGEIQLHVVPNGTQGKDWDKGIGTGGYILEEFEPGVRALTKRNPNYFKNDRAHFDEVETLGINDITARMNALMTNTVDAINRVDFKSVEFLAKKPGIKIVSVTGSRSYHFVMFTDVPPFDNNDVRLALKYAIDREAMLKIILRGYGKVGNDHPISPINRYHAAHIPQRKYDPEKAKFHLKKAGMSSLSVILSAAEVFPGAVDAALLFREQAAKAGIDIKVVREPLDGYWKQVWMKKPFCVSFRSGVSTEDLVFTQLYASDGNWNDTHWKHERFNELLVKARAELDETKRREMYYEMQQSLHDQGGTIIPLFTDNVDAANEKLKHGPLSGRRELDGNRIADRWWFES